MHFKNGGREGGEMDGRIDRSIKLYFSKIKRLALLVGSCIQQFQEKYGVLKANVQLKIKNCLSFFFYYSITGIKRFIFSRKISLSRQNNHWLRQTPISLLEFSVQYSQRSFVLWNSSTVCGPHHHWSTIYLFIYFQVLFNRSLIPDSWILDPDFPLNLEVSLIKIILFFSTTEVISCSKIINTFKR